MTRVAYLGPEGTFTESALSTLATLPGSPVGVADLTHARPEVTVATALAGVRAGETDGALVPLENSVEGSVPATMDGLAAGAALVITAEVFLEVSFALAVRPGTRADQVRTVASHPHGLAQCRRWLAEHLPGATEVLASSTAEAARDVAEGRHDAAVCAPLAGERYGLESLADPADNPGAVTRFVLVQQPGTLPAPTGADKTTVVAVVPDRTGALLSVLTEFAVRGISLTRIESRPTRERLGVYSFSLDCEGHVADRRVGEALTALHRLCAEVRFLGSYPRADAGARKQVPETVEDAAFAAADRWLEQIRSGG
ncbi:prephenate dehydratase [Goekera deserti]|nr:prephenate dehydratase [Goekera deserti]